MVPSWPLMISYINWSLEKSLTHNAGSSMEFRIFCQKTLHYRELITTDSKCLFSTIIINNYLVTSSTTTTFSKSKKKLLFYLRFMFFVFLWVGFVCVCFCLFVFNYCYYFLQTSNKHAEVDVIFFHYCSMYETQYNNVHWRKEGRCLQSCWIADTEMMYHKNTKKYHLH